MSIRVIPTAHGAASFDALAAAVRAAKGGDPLSPVAVVVPTNTAGVMARRALGRRGGAAAIDVLTMYRLAEMLGSPSLLDEGRKPVSTPVVDLAVKQVLAPSAATATTLGRAAGAYRDVAHHPSTVVVLRDLYREVRLAGPGALPALRRTERGGPPAAVAAAVANSLTAAWYDEADLLDRAVARVLAAPAPRFGSVVMFLPQQLRPRAVDLLRALAERGSVDLVVGLTGDDEADGAITSLVADLSGVSCPRQELRRSPHGGLRVDVVSTTDADDEVRSAVRAVLDGARRGVPFDRMAILWPVDRPYARLVEHHLTVADVPWNGRPGTATAERIAPRLLAELLELDRRGLRRTPLMTLLADVPARDRSGRVVPTARWERVGRRAGVIREADWEARLPVWITEQRERRPLDVAAAEQLHAFVTDLRQALGDPATVRTWDEWVRWSHEQLESWLGPTHLDRLEGGERTAWEQTQQVLDRLRHLDSIGPPVTRAEFNATFVAELDVIPTREGRIGDGVHVGALAGSTGIDVDLVVVLGAADGMLPPPPPVDPLLGDAERSAAGLVTSDERAAVALRHFLAAVVQTPDVVVTVPRGDLRATTVHHPSRWLTDALDGRRDVVEHPVDSYVHGLLATEFPVSPAEHRVRDLWASVRSGADVREHPLVATDSVVSRGLTLRDARSGDVLTIFDGDLSTREITALRHAVSPTAIERWVRCPHAYFVQDVLGVRPIDEPEEIMTISPVDRGSAVHEIIHRLQRDVLEGRIPAPGPDGWASEHADALARHFDEVTAGLQTAGRTGRAAYWANERTALAAELQQWIAADRAAWRGRRLRQSERSFGEPPVEIALPDGRTVAFIGQIDRIDEMPDGTIVVTDHKTGKVEPYKDITADDPTGGGTRFQLPVYAAAARVVLGRPTAAVRAEYAFFARGGFQRIGLDVDQTTADRVAHHLAEVVAGIESGFFPATPSEASWSGRVDCAFCEPDRLGAAERRAEWERKRADPRLSRWFATGDEDGS